jgi:hypothetical protein
MPTKCKSVITIPQFTGTCWFNALLMALLYSDGTRQYLLKNLINSELYSKNKRLYDIFIDILVNRYYKSEEGSDAIYFDELKPEKILKFLHNADKNTFYFDPDKYVGHKGEIYLVRLFEYFGLKDKVVYMFKDNKDYFYSPLNNEPLIREYNVLDESNKITNEKGIRVDFEYCGTDKSCIPKSCIPKTDPDMIVVTPYDVPKPATIYKSSTPAITVESNEIQEVIEYKNSLYKISSLLTTNWNPQKCSMDHQMAGVICENKRYIYNGWTRNTLDPAKISAYENEIGSVPCELMEFDWLLNKNDFCLAKNRCEIKEKTKLSGLCFNASRVDDNTYIYVRVDEDDEIAQTNVRKNLRKTYIRCSIEVEDIKREIKELNREIKELNREKTLLNNKIQSDRQIHQYKEGYIKDLELKTIKLELKIDQYDLKVDQLNEKNTSCSEHIKHINYILDKILNMIRERKEAEKKKKQIEEVNVTGGRRGYKKNTEKKIERGGRLNNNQGLNKSKKDVKRLKKEKKDVIVKKENKDVMVLNKLTNRYVKRTGVLGKKILSLLNNI